MSHERELLLLQLLLGLLGAVAAVTGLYAVLTGPSSQVAGEAVGASVESEYRFYAGFWLAFGLTALWLVPRVAREQRAVRVLAAALFLAGLARAFAWADAGTPRPLYLVLLALELGIPPVIVLWQRRIAGSVPSTR